MFVRYLIYYYNHAVASIVGFHVHLKKTILDVYESNYLVTKILSNWYNYKSIYKCEQITVPIVQGSNSELLCQTMEENVHF